MAYEIKCAFNTGSMGLTGARYIIE